MPSTADTFVLGFLVLSIGWTAWLIRSKYVLPRPPGPRGWPILGNMFDMPGTRLQSYKVFAEWGQRYGDIMSTQVLGQTIIILNSSHFATELLDKRGSSYSSRPNTQMTQLSKWDRTPGLGAYTSKTKAYRKMMAQAIGSSNAVKTYEWAANRAAVLMLQNILNKPRSFSKAAESATASFLVTLTYGYTPSVDGTDPHITKMQHVADIFGEMVAPGRFIVDTVPVARGECKPSFVSNVLTTLPEKTKEKRDILMWSAWAFYAAGTETMKAALLSFILAMTVYPEVQKKLQIEIDQVTGRDRLPIPADFAALPYLDAVCKESLRIFPGVPLGLPHEASKDDIFEGYSIPKGATVIANIWKFCHDHEVYQNPFEFSPDRFLGEYPECDPTQFVFGFGRRICPGSHLTALMVTLSIARLASAFTFSKARREDGSEIEPVWDQTSSGISQPVPFQCDIQLRHGQYRDIIENEVASLG